MEKKMNNNQMMIFGIVGLFMTIITMILIG